MEKAISKENLKMGKINEDCFYLSRKQENGTWQTNFLTREDLKTIVVYLGSGFDKF